MRRDACFGDVMIFIAWIWRILRCRCLCIILQRWSKIKGKQASIFGAFQPKKVVVFCTILIVSLLSLGGKGGRGDGRGIEKIIPVIFVKCFYFWVVGGENVRLKEECDAVFKIFDIY